MEAPRYYSSRKPAAAKKRLPSYHKQFQTKRRDEGISGEVLILIVIAAFIVGAVLLYFYVTTHSLNPLVWYRLHSFNSNWKRDHMTKSAISGKDCCKELYSSKNTAVVLTCTGAFVKSKYCLQVLETIRNIGNWSGALYVITDTPECLADRTRGPRVEPSDWPAKVIKPYLNDDLPKDLPNLMYTYGSDYDSTILVFPSVAGLVPLKSAFDFIPFENLVFLSPTVLVTNSLSEKLELLSEKPCECFSFEVFTNRGYGSASKILFSDVILAHRQFAEPCMLTMSVESFQTSGSLSQALMSSCSVRELPKEFIAFPNPKMIAKALEQTNSHAVKTAKLRPLFVYFEERGGSSKNRRIRNRFVIEYLKMTTEAQDGGNGCEGGLFL